MAKMCTMNFVRVILLLKFSSIGDDQGHEQNNKIVKGDGGPICGISDHEEALLEWVVCRTAIADMFQHLLDINENDCYQFHHENTENSEKTFRKNSNKIFEDFINNGNPFVECEQHLVNVVFKTVANKESSKSVWEVLSIGMVQKSDFIEESLVKKTK